MNDVSMDIQDELDSLRNYIAELLSELSLANSKPREVDILRSFEPEDVTFDGSVWIDFVLAVEDWLRLATEIGVSGDRQSQAHNLCTLLGAESPLDAYKNEEHNVQLNEIGLELLRARLDLAVQYKLQFEEELEVGDQASAEALWSSLWDDDTDPSPSGAIIASTGVLPLFHFITRADGGELILNPPYQRGDVWPIGDAQKLIESILRGIPLPSVIFLRPGGRVEAPYEVVDGKQRITAILRFVGHHPTAVATVDQAEKDYPGEGLKELFETNYASFRRKWKNVTGETLSAAKEAEYYFPFKLSSTSKAYVGELAPVRGRYFHEIKDIVVSPGGKPTKVGKLFLSSLDYAIPTIEYSAATPKQIHEVFSLYNKQGKLLTAEEIRNAVYQELLLMRMLAVASGDNTNIEGSIPSLMDSMGLINAVKRNFADYKFSDLRYKKTKILSWFTSMLLTGEVSADGNPRMLSTARQIDAMLESVEQNPNDLLRRSSNIKKLVETLATATDAHSASDAWSTKFRNSTGGARWQELQLVASLLGVTMAAVVLKDETDEVLRAHEKVLYELSESELWKRPAKTQTGKQWEFIAAVSLSILNVLGVDPLDVEKALLGAYGRSGVLALTKVRSQDGPIIK